MASGQQVHVDDLPPELVAAGSSLSPAAHGDWQNDLRTWARESLAQGRQRILGEALPALETILIEVALEHTGGRRQDAARLLGWGRNTLTRKIKELGLEEGLEKELG
jgi:two-component system nitrogen regulation response regulator GlnG